MRNRAVVTVAGLAVVAVILVATIGLPVDNVEPIIAASIIAFVLGWSRPDRGPLRLIADWLPVAVALYAYVIVRGLADEIGIGANFSWAPRIDHALTGVQPNVWIQHHIYNGNYDHWWNVFLTACYDSHFVVTPLVLAWLWSRRPDAFYGYRRRLLGLTFVGLAFFVLHPTAPPWMAAQRHIIDPIVRTSRLGTTTLHIHAAPGFIDSGARAVDQVTAFPSLHAGLATLPLVFFWRAARARTRVLLIAYPVGMGFTLVASGEHWLIDVLGVWILAYGVHRASLAYERRELPSRVARRRPVSTDGSMIEILDEEALSSLCQ